MGPGPALESQMKNERLARTLLAGGVLLAPLVASAHGTEFLLAKLTVGESSQLRLEVTADCGGNPLIADAKTAEELLPNALRVRIGDRSHPLSDFGRIAFESRTTTDPTAPLPQGAPHLAGPHQFLTAVWKWQPNCDSIRFEVPKGSLHDVLLWMIEPGSSTTNPRWSMLIAGDASPEIPISQRTNNQWWLLLGIGGVVLAAIPIAWLVRGGGHWFGRI